MRIRITAGSIGMWKMGLVLSRRVMKIMCLMNRTNGVISQTELTARIGNTEIALVFGFTFLTCSPTYKFPRHSRLEGMRIGEKLQVLPLLSNNTRLPTKDETES